MTDPNYQDETRIWLDKDEATAFLSGESVFVILSILRAASKRTIGDKVQYNLASLRSLTNG